MVFVNVTKGKPLVDKALKAHAGYM